MDTKIVKNVSVGPNNSLKKENYEFKDTFFINRKYLVFNLLIITTIFQAYLLFSGITGFGNTQTEVSGGSSFVSMLSSYLTPFALILAAYIIFIENNSNKKFQGRKLNKLNSKQKLHQISINFINNFKKSYKKINSQNNQLYLHLLP